MYEDIYKKLEVDLDSLGCVMLDLEPLADMKSPPEFLKESLYKTKNLKRKWINGWVVGETPHITLLYGLMENAHNWEPHIEKVLRDWDMKTVTIKEIGFFDSTYDDDDYYCIVAHIEKTPQLVEGHERLELLPHINTFTDYLPHMTVCYIKKNKSALDACLRKMNSLWRGKRLRVVPKINLGYKPGE